jgi:hypothetical protein
MNGNIKRVSLFVVAAGLFTFIVFGIMTSQYSGNSKPAVYPNERGFKTAIIWFELLDTPEELFLVLGEPGTQIGKRLRTTLDKINKYDFVFMVGYSLFYASLFLFTFVLLRDRKWRYNKNILYMGLMLSTVMLLGDMLENVKLLELSAYQTGAEVNQSSITMLRIFTRIKWFSIFIAGILLSFQYYRYFTARIAKVVCSILFLLPSITGFITFVMPNKGFFLEAGSNLLGITWIAALVHAAVKLFGKEYIPQK